MKSELWISIYFLLKMSGRLVKDPWATFDCLFGSTYYVGGRRTKQLLVAEWRLERMEKGDTSE